MPDQGDQLVEPPAKTQPPLLVVEDLMMKDLASGQRENAIEGGINATMGEDDFMIDVERFYSVHPMDNHHEPNAGTE